MTTQTTLYPDIEQVTTYNIEVGDGHHLYVEECGNPAGIPVVFLHGGPGHVANLITAVSLILHVIVSFYLINEAQGVHNLTSL